MLRCTLSNPNSHSWNTYSLYLGSQRDPISQFSEFPETRPRSMFDRRRPILPLPSPAPKFSSMIGRGFLGVQGTRGDDLATLFHDHTFPCSGTRNTLTHQLLPLSESPPFNVRRPRPPTSDTPSPFYAPLVARMAILRSPGTSLTQLICFSTHEICE